MRGGEGLSLVLMLFYLMSTLTPALMAVVTVELQAPFGLSASEVGLLTSVFMFAYGAVGIPAGVMANGAGYLALAAFGAAGAAGAALLRTGARPPRPAR